ncbi:hypothetical protein [Streptomyces sp. NBC_01236]|uniref:hypothetical protein n=1 Tax=Streptomyces sp. NBC_01236 TaxID=2903789 RepID=UPI002E0D9609|nr:hypothetical protein OG324_26950 [Streptomyces sp. NBC_01236]
MAKFTPAQGLEEALARMVARLCRIAHQVEIEAKRLAPPTKRWVTTGDDRLRLTHVAAQGQEVPGNLRFEINSMQWDIEHRGVGAHTYILEPRPQLQGYSQSQELPLHHAQGPGRHRPAHRHRPACRRREEDHRHRVLSGPKVVKAEVGTVYVPRQPGR